ncbi:MAG TPA: L,D-transpeptidase family protein [Gemmatimonadales bacterium]|nr:L,D-transpeptidase family protein [Gemmatimonadales bacterium]
MKGSWFVLCGLQVALSPIVSAQGTANLLAARVAADSDSSERRVLIEVYGSRAYRPFWISDTTVKPAAMRLTTVLGHADEDGLDPRRYALESRTTGPDSAIETELRLTRILLAYARDVSAGRFRPGPRDSLWSAAPAPIRFSDLGRALDSLPLDTVLRRLAPPQRGYTGLRAALERYHSIAERGGWDSLSNGPDLAPGARGIRVLDLRRRLAAEDDGDATETADDRFDGALARRVLRFQAKHGLEADGIVGAATRAALNVPVEQRIRQIELNLERWRWLPRRLGERYIMVNSAAFSLALVGHDTAVLTMRAIVGRVDWPTPIIISRVTNLIFHPSWDIPKKIVLAEVVPFVLRDTGYLARERITVLRWTNGAWRPVDRHAVDWRALNDSSYSLRLVQAPGATNPLGGVKFEFANRFGSYIHDTPQRSLFEQRIRAFSHGCIRAERAAQLARILLADSAQWPRDSVDSAMRGPETRVVTLERGIPVYVSYWTAWVDPDGTLQFRDDVYGWDRMLAGQ